MANTNASLVLNTPTTGTITNADDTITYTTSTNLTAGRIYTIRMVGAGTDPFTLGDPEFDNITSSGGTYIGTNNDGLISGPYGRDAMFTFTAPTTTTYTFVATGDLLTTGTFQITLTDITGGSDVVPANTTTTYGVSPGDDPVTGTIDDGADSDWYKVSLVAGTTYTFRLRGLTSGGGTLPDPVISGLYNSSGVYIMNTYVDDMDTRDATLTYSAPYTGDYYIAVDGWSTYTGTYSLAAAITGSDVAGSSATTATLALGTSAQVVFEQPYDHDWFAVTLTAGGTYQFTMSGTGYNNTPGLHGILNSAGTYVVSHANPTYGPATASVSTIYTPTQTGTYYIDTYSLYEGTYTLTAVQTAYDVPAGINSTETIAVNSSVMGDIGGATDLDWYKVTLTEGKTYSIRMQGKQSGVGTLEDPIIAGIYDATGALVDYTFADDTDGNEASLVFKVGTGKTGTYFIAADGYSGYIGTFKLSVTEIQTDVGQTKADAATVVLNTPTVVTIDSTADVDWYKISLTAGTTYGIRLQGSHTKRGTLYDPVLVGIYDDNGVNGTLIADTFVDDAGELRNPKLMFTPTTSGVYYIATDGYDRYTGTAKLAVTTDNVGDTDATATVLTLDANSSVTVEGTIDAVGDVDRYRVSLAPSTTYYVRMLGFYSRNGDLADPNATVAIATGGTPAPTVTNLTDAIAVGQTNASDAWIKVVTGATAGNANYYITASGGNNSDGAYLLTVDKDLPATGTPGVTINTIPGSYYGYIDEGNDADWIAVSLTANTGYLIKMRGFDSNNGTLLNPQINGVRLSTTPTTIINDATQGTTSGTTVDNVDTRDSLVRFIPSAPGTYYIEARGSGTTVYGSYLLTIETEPGNTAASAWTLPGLGSWTGTIDDSTDTDWYGVALNTNTSYLIRMRGVDSGKGTLDNPYINGIYASTNLTTAVAGTNGTAVDNAVLRDSVARIIPTSPGTYYIVADSSAGTLGSYLLSVETEVGNTFATAGTAVLNGSVAGSIDDNTDSDYFKITLDSTKSYVFKMLVTGGAGTLRDTLLAVRNSSDVALTVTNTATGTGTHSSTANYSFRVSNATNGDYYLEAKSAGAYNGTFRLTAEVEPGSTLTTASAIAVGGSVNGTIDDNSDTDYYKITLNSTNSYVFKMIVSGGVGTLSDTTLGLLNSSSVAQTATGSRSSTADHSFRFAPGTPGDYYITAAGTGTNSGTYRLSAEIEAGNSTASALTLNIGQTLTGIIDDTTDIDYYKVALNSTSGYLFKMTVTNGAGTLGDTSLTVRDGAGTGQTPIVSTSGTADYYIRWTPGTSGDYYLDARWGTAGANIGSYRISAEAEAGQTTTSAGSMTVGQTVNGNIDDSADIDYYRIALSTTSSYIIRMTVSGGVGTLGDTSLTVRNGSDAAQTVTASDASTTDYYIRWTPGASADYYLDARWGTGGANTGTYRLTAVTEPGQSTTSAGTMTVGQTVNGNIDDSTDIDYYRIALSTTASYIFRMTVSGGVGTLGDTSLTVRNGSDAAQTVAASDASTTDFYIRWTPGASADYYLDARWGTGGANTGTYRLTAVTEAGSTIASAGAINVGQTVNSTIDDVTDTDYYKVTLTNSKSYLFKMIVSGGVGTLGDTALTMRNGSDVVQTVSGTTSDTADFFLRWAPTTSGTYYIEAKGTGANAGTYRLIADTEAGNTIASAGSFAVGETVNAAIDDTADVDYYKITLSNTSSYSIRMTVSGGAGTLSDATIVSIRDAAGNVQSGVNVYSPGVDSAVRWTPTTSGSYYVELKGTGSNYGTYRLTAAYETGGTVASASSIAVGIPVDDTIDDESDTDYFRVSLDSAYSYVFKMVVSGGVGTLSDTNMTLRNGSNAVVTVTGTNSASADYSMRWTPTAIGDYYIEAKGTGLNAGTYRLVAALETGTNASNYGALVVGGMVDDTIDDDADTDYYRISLTSGTSYLFKMVVSGGVGTLADTNIVFHDLSNNVVAATGSTSTTSDYSFRWTGSAGDYFIEAQGTGANSGTYRLLATTETGTNASNYGTIAVGQSIDDTIDDNADTDYYRITLAGNTSYVFNMVVSGGVGTLDDTSIVFRNLSNSDISASGGSNANGSDFSFRWSGSAGDYFIEAKGTGANNGTYRLVAATETGTNTSNYGTLAVGGTVNDTIDDNADTDYYRISLLNTKSYLFKMTVSGGVGTLSDTALTVRDLSNNSLGATGSDSTSANFSFRYEPGTSTDYYLAAAGTGSNAGTYRLTAEIEAGSNIAKSLATTVGSTINAAIDDANDVDYYSVALSNTRSYQFRMVSSGGVGTLADSSLQVRDSLDAIQTPLYNNATGSDSMIRWEPGTSTTYYLDARGVSSGFGTYRLIVEEEGGPTRAKAMPITVVGTTLDAWIDTAGEADYYQFTLSNNLSYIFKAISSGGVGTLTDSLLALYNSGGTGVTATGSNNTGSDYYLRYQVGAAGGGTYYINATGPSNAVGSYDFIFEKEPGTTTTAAMGGFVGVPVVSMLEDTTDSDWWSFDLVAGYKYSISMVGSGTLNDTYINGIYNSSGTLQAGTQVNPASGDAFISSFIPNFTGQYYVNCDAGTAVSGTYTLLVTQVEPAPGGMEKPTVTLPGVTTFDAGTQEMGLI